MWTSFLQGLGSTLANRWVVAILTPAFVFWGLGLVALRWHDDKSLWHWGLASFLPNHSRYLHVPFPHDMSKLPIEAQLALLISGLLVVGISAAGAQRLALPTLRLAEGYWPTWLNRVRRIFVRPKVEAVKQATAEREDLRKRAFDAMTRDEHVKLARLDEQLRQSPKQERILPTKLGNVLRAAEELPEEKYGLNSLVCWPRLWLLLPGDVKKELTDSRAELNTASLAFLWSLLFCLWTIWAWWAAPLGLVAALMAYRSMVMAAKIYGSLIESTFDVHRLVLYKALRWPLPKNPVSERKEGERITQYLYFGFPDKLAPIFAEDDNSATPISLTKVYFKRRL